MAYETIAEQVRQFNLQNNTSLHLFYNKFLGRPMRATFEMFNKVKVTRAHNQQGIEIINPERGVIIHIDSKDIRDLITAIEYLVDEAKEDKYQS